MTHAVSRRRLLFTMAAICWLSIGVSAGMTDTAAAPNAGEQAVQSETASNSGSALTPAGSSAQLQEVIVTAEKRSENIQDVPVPVSAISANTLLESGAVRLQDYFASVPGMNVTLDDYGNPQVTIRGLTTGGYTNPTVGIVVDDVPYGSSSSIAYGQEAPDIDPSDLSRVEVLRGPQGTLYGANSLGGLVKYVTIDPSPRAFTGSVEVGTEQIHNGDGLGYSARGQVNVPLNQTLAVRVSGFTRTDPGYIDDPILGIDGVNERRSSGGRLSGLWIPSDDLSLKFGAMIQHTTQDGSSYVQVEPGLQGLQQNDVAGSGVFRQTVQVYSAELKARLGAVNLTSVTGYNINEFYDSFDFTSGLGPLTQGQFGVPGTVTANDLRTNKFTQELRLGSQIGRNVDWLLGLFYDHEGTPQNYAPLFAEDPSTGTVVGQWLWYYAPSTFEQRAVFANLTLHITGKFDIQFGGRESQDRQFFQETFIGPYNVVFLGEPYSIVHPPVYSRENDFTYLVTPQYRFSKNLMTYVRVASGYRPGGPNSYTVAAAGLPSTYKHDTTVNYEVGAKGEFFENALLFDASLYYIQWKDIQLQLLDPVTTIMYFANGSRAKSQGVELSVQARPLQGMSISAWTTWDDAQLTEPFPASSTAYGVQGDRLPYSSRFSGDLSVEQEFPLGNRASGYIGGDVSYVGDREGVFASTATSSERQAFPAYTKIGLKTGIEFGSWKVSLFVDNLTDRRGLLNGGIGLYDPVAFDYIQPRTVGLSVKETF